jgi:nicotinamidase-related amidase
MATIRDTGKTILLVVDVQKGVVGAAHERDKVVANIASLVDKARLSGVPVLWVQHSDAELVEGSESWEMVPELVPASAEKRFRKQHNSSFEGTGLEAALKELGASRIVLVGAATNWCIRATAYAALERGYDLCLIKDAHTTESIEFQDGRKIAAADIIDELNVAMSWLSYPGRKNEAVKTADFSFA